MSSESTSVVDQQGHTERVERFQALQPGQYWTSIRDVHEEGIRKGTTLLLVSLRWVDDKPHTVILRPHPNEIGQWVCYAYIDSSGKEAKEWFSREEIRFLLDDFLSAFEFEPDYQRIRGEEIRQAQARINELQNELLESQSNPQVIQKVVQERLAQPAPANSSAGEKNDDSQVAYAQQMATGSISNAIQTGLTAASVDQMRQAASREHEIATIKATWIQERTEQIGEALKALTPYYSEQAAAALAATEDVRTYVAKLMQGIESLDLYVGKDVTVTTIKEGHGAPQDVPLSFVQRKLMMDQELCTFVDLPDNFDYRSIDKFHQALRDHEGLVNQVFPTQRCVLVMAVTAEFIDYGDRLDNAILNQHNAKVFLMIRNGENIYQVNSPVESHLGASRLFPSRVEHDQIFTGLDGRQIKVEDVAYTDRLSAHERSALHYKRFLLLVCGLDHRLDLFGKFYEEPKSMNFVSLEFQKANCRFIHDDDGDGMLPGTSLMPLGEWIKEKNRYLQAGSRVLCNWEKLMTPQTAPAAVRYVNWSRNEWIYSPRERLSSCIVRESKGNLVVEAPVEGTTTKGAERTFNCVVNLSAFKDEYFSAIPMLCLDQVEEAELERYIRHRDTRSGYVASIVALKKAREILQQERQKEEPCRLALVSMLLNDGISQSVAIENTQRAIRSWRIAFRGDIPPIPGDRRWDAIVKQCRILCVPDEPLKEMAWAIAREQGTKPLRLSTDATGSMILYLTPAEHERDDRLEPHVWVRRLTLKESKRGMVVKSAEWCVLPQVASTETIRYEGDEAKVWSSLSSRFSSPEQKARLMSFCDKSWTDILAEPTATFSMQSEEAIRALFSQWSKAYARMNEKSRLVVCPSIAFPFALCRDKSDGGIAALCVTHRSPEALLYTATKDDALKRDIYKSFVQRFENKEAASKIFNNKSRGWELHLISRDHLDQMERAADVFIDPSAFHRVSGEHDTDMRLDPWVSRYREEMEQKKDFWFSNLVREGEGVRLDSTFGTRLPDDYEPFEILALYADSGARRSFVFDVYPLPQEVVQYERRPGSLGLSGAQGPVGRMMENFAQTRPAGFSNYCAQRLLAATAAQVVSVMQKFVGGMDVDFDETLPRLRLVNASDLPDFAQAPKGAQRWYALPGARGE